uniref:Uncharacterized protein n=1 Tax=Vespula pensylvanica TaxID=30213 RepID=A0A834U477_VESPE|nr:hypothetical protein H0235_012195 [Vespula pensylvanica]
MRSTCLILLFAMAAILAFFEVNAEPLAEPLADANPTATTRRRGRPPGFTPFRSEARFLLVAAVAALGFFEVNAEPVANPSANPLTAAFANAYPQADIKINIY